MTGEQDRQTTAHILISDDDEMVCKMMADFIKGAGHTVSHAVRLDEGIRELRSGDFDLVFLDVRMPDGNGIQMLPKIRQSPSSPEVIIMTAAGDPDGAELALNTGAWHYLQKPLSLKKVLLHVTRVIQYRDKKKLEETEEHLKLKGVLGNSQTLEKCVALAHKVAKTDANLLLTGETGTGKELFARAIHDISRRSGGPFVIVDCSVLPETLVESTLYGHVKGAYTGADRHSDGLVKMADGGTLFIDEIGELPGPIQSVFLRVLQEHRFRPVGSSQEIESDFRLIAATNRNIEELVETGHFRSDLFFRLRSVEISLPPLRGRKQDIADLALHYMDKICARYGVQTKEVSSDCLEVLTAYDWPGNVRELINSLESAITNAYHEPTLFPDHLPLPIRVNTIRAAIGNENAFQEVLSDRFEEKSLQGFPMMSDFKHWAEAFYLKELMRKTQGRRNAACQLSGISRTRLFELLKKHGLSDRDPV